MKMFTLAILLAATSLAQPKILIPATAYDNLPDYTVGAGPSWHRGDNTPFSVDVTVAKRVKNGWYWWNDISTPMNNAAISAPSLITTGVAWVAMRSADGSVALVGIGRGGMSSSPITGNISPVVAGDLGMAFKIGKSHWYVFPCLHATSITYGNNGAVASAIIQPSVFFMYGIGGN